jgi:hypothetical protein
MRDRELGAFARANPDLAELVAGWRKGHPAATLRHAVADLQLWKNPDDKDAQWYVWCALRDQGDPVAAEGFPAMRARARAAAAP